MGHLRMLPPRIVTLNVGNLSSGRPAAAHLRGYDTAWHKAAAAYKLANPQCVGCKAMGLPGAATVVDHIEPHRGDRARFWDRTNWQSSCDFHHSSVKQKLEWMFSRREVRAADLRLDSAMAVDLARRMRGRAFDSLEND